MWMQIGKCLVVDHCKHQGFLIGKRLLLLRCLSTVVKHLIGRFDNLFVIANFGFKFLHYVDCIIAVGCSFINKNTTTKYNIQSCDS